MTMKQVMNRGRPGLGVNQRTIPLPTVAGILAVTGIAVIGVIAVVGVAVRHHGPKGALAAPTSAQAGLLTVSDLGADWRTYDKAIPRTTATTSLPDATQNSLTAGVNQCLNGDGFPGGSANRASGHFLRDAGPKADLFASVDEWSSPLQAEEAFGAYSVDSLTSCFANAGEQAASQHIKEWGWPSLRGGQTYIQVLPKPNVGMHAVAGRSVITMQFLIDTTAHVYIDVIAIQEGRYTTSLTVVSSFLPLSEDAEYAVEKAADSRLQSLSA
jgi:hypothetical protein